MRKFSLYLVVSLHFSDMAVKKKKVYDRKAKRLERAFGKKQKAEPWGVHINWLSHAQKTQAVASCGGKRLNCVGRKGLNLIFRQF